MSAKDVTDRNLQIEYFEGNSVDFVLYVQGKKDKAELVSCGGFFRWKLTRDDGSEYILRPSEARP